MKSIIFVIHSMGDLIKIIHSIKNLNLYIYVCAIAMLSLSIGLSFSVISNYFKDAYNVTAYQRGFLEFPRELPGIICLFIISALSFISDIKLTSIALFLSAVTITILGIITPSFIGMSFLIFLHSLGIHLTFPLSDAIGISLIKNNNKVGKRLGQYEGVKIAFGVIAGLIVFFGFRFGGFSFTNDLKLVFVLSGIAAAIASLLFMILNFNIDYSKPKQKAKTNKFRIDKDYKFYYLLAIIFGVQKQIAAVFGPWVLIDLLSKTVETISVLNIISSLFCVFFIPFIGRMIDRFGFKKMLYFDAISYIVIYVCYGIISGLFENHTILSVGLPLFFAYGLYILDIMSERMGIIRTSYLRSIAKSDEDIKIALSTGLSLDHVVSITCAYLGGIIWIKYGAQYIFYIAATLSLVNLIVAFKVKENSNKNAL